MLCPDGLLQTCITCYNVMLYNTFMSADLLLGRQVPAQDAQWLQQAALHQLGTPSQLPDRHNLPQVSNWYRSGPAVHHTPLGQHTPGAQLELLPGVPVEDLHRRCRDPRLDADSAARPCSALDPIPAGASAHMPSQPATSQGLLAHESLDALDALESSSTLRSPNVSGAMAEGNDISGEPHACLPSLRLESFGFASGNIATPTLSGAAELGSSPGLGMQTSARQQPTDAPLHPSKLPCGASLVVETTAIGTEPVRELPSLHGATREPHPQEPVRMQHPLAAAVSAVAEGHIVPPSALDVEPLVQRTTVGKESSVSPGLQSGALAPVLAQLRLSAERVCDL